MTPKFPQQGSGGPAFTLGQATYNKGRGLLSGPIAGNQFGQVDMNSPTKYVSPWLQKQANGIRSDTQDFLGDALLGIQGNAVASGGLGGSRQGIAQGQAIGKAADYLSQNLAGMYGNAWDNAANRSLQQYGIDTGFATAQRGQDLAQYGLGSGMIQQGLDTQWSPIRNAASVYSPFTGFGSSTSSSNEGGGWLGALGGGLGVLGLGSNLGWWGKK